jgi:phosphoenolpyruvate carboxylase
MVTSARAKSYNNTPTKAPAAAVPKASARSRDNERPLVEDIRLLGRILGDVIREQEGVAAYRADRAGAQALRRLPARRRPGGRQGAQEAAQGPVGDQTVSVIRAFTYFSHLANLAEDRHHIRRRAVHERAGDTQEGSIEVALARLRWAGISTRTISNTLAHSFVSPVLTAHPTEVQRKSILDAERDIAQLLTARDDIKALALAHNAAKDALTPRELAANEAQLRARVMQLWQPGCCAFPSSPWPTRSRTR